MAGLNQAQLFQSGMSSMTIALERGTTDGDKQQSYDSRENVRTHCKAGQLKMALHILNQRGILADSTVYVCLLQECIKMKGLAEGRQVHAHIIQSGIMPTTFLLNSLINMYAKCGSVVNARIVFDKMPERDLFTWNSMIAGYATHGCVREAFEIYEQMKGEGVTPNRVTVTCILKACARLASLEKGKEVHADMCKAGIVPDVILETALVSMYAKCGSMKDAHEVFDDMAEPNVVAWSTMIEGYTENGYGSVALNIYEQMVCEGVTANKVTFICVLNACASLGNSDKGKEVHADIRKAGIVADIILETALVTMYAKCGNIQEARRVFDNMAQRNVVSWSAMIAGYAQHGYGREALAMYDQMVQKGVKPDRVTFVCVLNACAILTDFERGKAVHVDIIRAGIAPHVVLETALVTMYTKCGSIKDARQVFDNMAERDVVSWNAMSTAYAQHGCGGEALQLFEQMQQEGLKPDVASWNAVIAGYAQHGSGGEALAMYEQMIQQGVLPNKVTFICVLKACASLAALERGKEVHADIIKAGIASYVNLENTLVDMYAKCGSLEDARQVFDNMAERDVVSWSAMIAGYAQHGCGREALQLFEQMQQEALKPNVVSWNAMVAGYAQHGHGREAVALYAQMIREGVTPDKVTFISVLKACASLAALEKGKQVHADILKAGSLPDIIVETALADMYAKCGNMKGARQVFDNMAERNVVSWSAMIAGYAQHGHGMEALQLFEEMQQKGSKPNGITLACVLSACSHVGLVDEGGHYFESMTQNHGVTPTVEHFGCMVDLLGRAGRLEEAEDLINKMPIEPSAAVWGALLGACRIHGNVEVAERAATGLLKCDPQDAATYVMLSNIYAAAGRWDDTAKVRRIMQDRGVKRQPGCSPPGINNRVHTFVVDKQIAATN